MALHIQYSSVHTIYIFSAWFRLNNQKSLESVSKVFEKRSGLCCQAKSDVMVKIYLKNTEPKSICQRN